MTTREFMQHILLNGELDDPVTIEVFVPDNKYGFTTFEPAHVTRIGSLEESETLIECKPYKEET